MQLIYLVRRIQNLIDVEFPELRGSLKIGSIIEARLHKSEESCSYFSHFVTRVVKIWDRPLFHIRSKCNIVQMTVECDLSEPGRCRRELVDEEPFFVLQCKYGIEVGIPTKRLMNYLEDDLTMKGCTLECTSLLMEGGPASFRVLDTCKIIK
ncbi:hypothetical protein PMAYCL1PPCAC_12390, partial [Pristionchus mayeri]